MSDQMTGSSLSLKSQYISSVPRNGSHWLGVWWTKVFGVSGHRRQSWLGFWPRGHVPHCLRAWPAVPPGCLKNQLFDESSEVNDSNKVLHPVEFFGVITGFKSKKRQRLWNPGLLSGNQRVTLSPLVSSLKKRIKNGHFTEALEWCLHLFDFLSH